MDKETGLLAEQGGPSYGTVPTSGAKADSELPRYRPDIDGLRAIAVLAVIIFHVNPVWLPGGFLGVDIFYVVSGFVVTGSLLAAPQASVCEYFSHFYARRLLRLSPALCLFIATTALLLPPMMTLVTETSAM